MAVRSDTDLLELPEEQVLEWYREIPVKGIAKLPGTLHNRGFLIGGALVATLTCGFLVLLLSMVIGFGGIDWLVSLALVGAGVVRWLARAKPRRPITDGTNSWRAEFVVDDLGAGVFAGQPPTGVAVALRAELRSRAMTGGIWNGIWCGLFAGIHALRLRLPGKGMLLLYLGDTTVDSGDLRFSINWGHVMQVEVDERARVFDLRGTECAGLRLQCTPGNFPVVRAFISEYIHPVLWPSNGPAAHEGSARSSVSGSVQRRERGDASGSRF
jgi:hypothetical protein